MCACVCVLWRAIARAHVFVCVRARRKFHKITIQRETSTGHTYAFAYKIKDCNQRKCLVVDKKLIAQLGNIVVAMAKIEFRLFDFCSSSTHSIFLTLCRSPFRNRCRFFLHFESILIHGKTVLSANRDTENEAKNNKRNRVSDWDGWKLVVVATAWIYPLCAIT